MEAALTPWGGRRFRFLVRRALDDHLKHDHLKPTII